MIQILLYWPCKKGKAVINLILTLKSSSSKTSYTTLMLCNSLISYPLLSSLPFLKVQNTPMHPLKLWIASIRPSLLILFIPHLIVSSTKVRTSLNSIGWRQDCDPCFRKKFDSVYLLAELTRALSSTSDETSCAVPWIMCRDRIWCFRKSSKLTKRTSFLKIDSIRRLLPMDYCMRLFRCWVSREWKLLFCLTETRSQRLQLETRGYDIYCLWPIWPQRE